MTDTHSSKPLALVAGALSLGLALALTGCNPLDLLKQPVPSPSASPAAAASPSPSQVPARRAKANSELLREMYFVVYGEEPKDRAEFGNMADSLNQGASLEGVYNGFTHSTQYRKLEAEHPGASPEALKVFSEELALLEQDLPAPTDFTADAAKPLAVLNQGAEESAPAPESDVQTFSFPGKKTATPAPAAPRAVQAPADTAALTARYMKLFSGASIYTLKRVLADEAMKVVSAKQKSKPELAAWYGTWAARLAGKKVDFGIPQRNLADAAFHTKWAMNADEDQLRWEVLNRIHRLLNQANGKKS